MNVNVVIIYVLGLCLHFCLAQNSGCNNKETCSDCIQEIACVWCVSPKNSSGAMASTHCLEKNANLEEWCPEEHLVNPLMSAQVVKNDPLSSESPIIQIQPQYIKLNLRKGESYDFSFKYQQAKNFPVDLYYLMDLSASMKVHKEKLGELGSILADTMRKITNNFRLGFGSFVDKVELPYTSTLPKKLQEPCTGCASPYSFINHLSLDTNEKRFEQEVKKAKVSGNLDSPEGGFDALMQVMVCEDVINWRNDSRRLIVFSTDADFHIAGDGKLAGIVEPNDAKCHMVDDKYTESLTYDYPSVSHINYVAKENNFNIIFAIAEQQNTVLYQNYENLQKAIENSGVGALDSKSSNVVNLIIDNYNKIADRVTITDTGSDEGVEVKYIKKSCESPIPNVCNEVKVGEIVDFTVKITPTRCLDSPKNITIKREGNPGSIIIELNVTCDCNCQQNSIPNDASNCNGNGTFECGICKCKPGYFGSTCECDNDSINTNNTDSCKADPTLPEICSGQGICKCGKCECNNKKNYGKYCECSDTSCTHIGGKLCNGNGVCKCGECQCSAGWSGEACDCQDSLKECTDPANPTEICSGQGNCSCGECLCKEPYNGKYCGDCPTCAGRCKELSPCVECLVFEGGPYNKSECSHSCKYRPILVDKIDESNIQDSVKLCIGYDADDCKFIFQYSYNDDKNEVLTVQKTKICNKIDVLALVLGLIGSIVLAGLILLVIWKVATMIHDKREYAKFEEEKKKAKWHRGENPIFKPAVSEFQNIAYTQ